MLLTLPLLDIVFDVFQVINLPERGGKTKDAR